MEKTYFGKLKDPRWQKMRLRVLERDSWKCLQCGDATNTLHVHHTYYESNLEPWDYPLESLLTLCELCHEAETEIRKRTEDDFLQQARRAGILADDFLFFIDLFPYITLRGDGRTALRRAYTYLRDHMDITVDLEGRYMRAE